MQFNVPFLFTGLYYVLQGALHASDFLGRVPGSLPVIADTNYGKVKGTRHFGRGRTPYTFFRGIPYARPPIGNLRFAPPARHLGWGNNILPATYYRDMCIQINIADPKQNPIGSEDCLFLNIATRKSFRKNQLPYSGYRPVIVWIHGGHFMLGSSNAFPPKYFMAHDIVLVSINYRLGSFGFLNTGDGVISGNMGLKDQTLALKWIQENIKYFNGDASKVTIFGESAGSVCVHLHTISPLSRGLFSGAISASGTALSPWAIIDNPREQALEFAEGFGCSNQSSEKMVECLRKIPARRLAAYHSGYIIQEVEGKRGIFGPTIDSTSPHHPPFLPDHPLTLMQNGQIAKVPWINGVDSGDGLIFMMPIFRTRNLREKLNRNWEHYAPLLMLYSKHPQKDQVSVAVKYYYFQNRPVELATLKEAGEMMSDRGFFLDSHNSCLLQSRVAPTYAYYYAYEGLFALADLAFTSTNKPLIESGFKWASANALQIRPKNKYGVCHGDELPLMFNMPTIRREAGPFDVDFQFSKKLVKLWVSFAEYGIPDPQMAGENVIWSTVEDSNPSLDDIPLKRLLIKDTFSIIDEPFFNRIQFWKQFNIQ